MDRKTATLLTLTAGANLISPVDAHGAEPIKCDSRSTETLMQEGANVPTILRCLEKNRTVTDHIMVAGHKTTVLNALQEQFDSAALSGELDTDGDGLADIDLIETAGKWRLVDPKRGQELTPVEQAIEASCHGHALNALANGTTVQFPQGECPEDAQRTDLGCFLPDHFQCVIKFSYPQEYMEAITANQ